MSDKKPLIEVNFDGIVGPTHNYSGLSYGNVASLSSTGQVSSPKQAALQGLAKAWMLAERGVPQGVLPPQPRPSVDFLRNLGFAGDVLAAAALTDPILLSLACSSSFMWTANAATVCPSADSADGRVHLTPANLPAKPHRAIEADRTRRALEAVFSDAKTFVVHNPLEGGDAFSDEGAANHTRFAFGDTGHHLFVYGRKALDADAPRPRLFPARQTLEASRAIARLNCVPPKNCSFVQQNPQVIDAGVFHNDVISVGHERVFFYHEAAFVDTEALIARLANVSAGEFIGIKVKQDEVDLQTAVASYLFNSQIVTLPAGHMMLVAPWQCREDGRVRALIDKVIADQDNPIDEVLYVDLLQSMKNGGGPACLRLRVQLTKEELARVNPACLLDRAKYEELVAWVGRHYWDELRAADLADKKLQQSGRAALLELADILKLGSLYV